MTDLIYKHRYIARIVLEAASPLTVGTGDKSILTNEVVATDVNGLPYIPGSSIAGVVRHAIGEEKVKFFFGNQEERDDKGKGRGSEIIFTEARMIGYDGRVIDGLVAKQELFDSKEIEKQEFYEYFRELPIRQHVRINEKGTNTDAGKFDEQVVYKGARFCFEIEMVAKGEEEDKTNFYAVLEALKHRTFRIGGGSRKGFGEIKIISIRQSELDLTKEKDLNHYLDKSSKLSDEWEFQTIWQPSLENESSLDGWTEYKLTLEPEDFFLFGSGLGNDKADMTPVTEPVVVWSETSPAKPEFKTRTTLIPASSVKGALSHRVAFHHNRLHKRYAEDKPGEAKTGSNNIAVKALFGCDEGNENTSVQRGNVILSDVIEESSLPTKLLNHVSIDRFTGGAIKGALFSEETVYGKGKQFAFTILVDDEALEDKKVEEAFEAALHDICNGMLPLGGGVNRGNGIFTGTITKNGKGLTNGL